MIGHTWSLSVEEHFYLIWPPALMALARLRRERAIAILVSVALASWVWREWSFIHLGRLATYARFDTHMTGLILGSLLAFLPALKAPRATIPVVVGAAVVATALQGVGQYTLAISAAEVGATALLLWTISARRPVLEWAPLVY